MEKKDKLKTPPDLLGRALFVLGAIPEQAEKKLYDLTRDRELYGDADVPTHEEVLEIANNLRGEINKVKELLETTLDILEPEKTQ